MVRENDQREFLTWNRKSKEGKWKEQLLTWNGKKQKELMERATF